MTVNRRLLLGSLAVAIAVVVAVGVVTRSNSVGDSGTGDDVTLTSAGDLSPTIGTNAAVTGRALPVVDIQTLTDDTLSTADLLGRPLIINFWYSTCAPCKRELPAFAAAHGKFGNEVRFVGLDPLPPSDTEESFARDKGVKYELYYDSDGELTSTVGVSAFPQTLLIDAGGTIVRQTGELTEEELDELIRTELL